MATIGRTAVLEFLGTGTSTGVPMAGCTCPRCLSADPRDTRLRSSARIANGSRNLLIDTGPEFRIQCLRSGIFSIDSVLITHDHADHLHGIDDLRAFSLFKRKTLPVWAGKSVLDVIRSRFGYIWSAKQKGGGLPDLKLCEVKGRFRAAGMEVTPLPIMHGCMEILGYRIGDLAYMTDISSVPESTYPLLENLTTMVVSTVRRRPHPTHLNISGVKKLHKRVRPKQTILTHLAHWLTHKELIMELPVDITPAYDGMTVEIRL
jgi:phosphoribosyl 1,2-cyclic phosphate phosphodiesterase